MTPRWRVTLRVRALLQVLLESYVPHGTLSTLVHNVAENSDDELVEDYARGIGRRRLGWLAVHTIELANLLVGEEPFEASGKAQHPGEPSDLLRVHDEITRRLHEARARDRARGVTGDVADTLTGDVADTLDELLTFMAPLHGRPLPDLARFEAWLDGPEFAELLQEYDYECPSKPGDDAFEAVKAAIRKAARQ